MCLAQNRHVGLIDDPLGLFLQEADEVVSDLFVVMAYLIRDGGVTTPHRLRIEPLLSRGPVSPRQRSTCQKGLLLHHVSWVILRPRGVLYT